MVHEMTSPPRPLRFGLVGTGYWARITHAPALAAAEGVEFAAVWGRDRRATAELAAAYHVAPHHEESAFLAGVDAVAFAVPPDVQAPFAARAARAGKHLLLEKPVALAEEEADALVDAVEQARAANGACTYGGTANATASTSARNAGSSWCGAAP